MHLAAVVAASTAFSSGVLAQKLFFTDWPHAAVANNAYTITWTGGNGSPVTIKLLAGSTINLQEVSTLTTAGSNNAFTWVVPPTSPVGSNFALSIGDSDPNDLNYIGGISLIGGTGTIATTVVPVSNASSSVPMSTAASSTGYPMIRNATFCPGTEPPTLAPAIATAPPIAPTLTPPEESGAVILARPLGLIWVLLGLLRYWQ